MDKVEARKHFAQLRNQLTESEAAQLSNAILENLKTLLGQKFEKDSHSDYGFESLMTFSPIMREINTLGWVRELIDKGFKVLFPKVIKKSTSNPAIDHDYITTNITTYITTKDTFDLDDSSSLIPSLKMKTMEAIQVNSLDREEMIPGYQNILEPVSSQYYREPIDVVLVPGIAYNSERQRIGYGGAFYDRFLQLPHLQNSLKVGLFYDFQFIDFPVDSNDVAMDFIVTPEKIF